MENKMYCNQCQETAGCTACTNAGVCGKTPETANLQDLLILNTKGLCEITTILRKNGQLIQPEINTMIVSNLFATVTNVNFDADVLCQQITETLRVKELLINQISDAETLSDAALWSAGSKQELLEKSRNVCPPAEENEDIRSLKQLVTYGLKGLSAYVKHAGVLDYHKESIHEFIQDALARTLDKNISQDELIQLVLDCGKMGVEGMALLDEANTASYGHPELTSVKLGTGTNPGILISGHDLKDLAMLLDQTKGTGIDVYTHCEMLPAHYYPFFKKYENFIGNYGSAWWNQKTEFESFRGPVLMTTNCIVPPLESYKARLYTTGETAFPGCVHIPHDEKGNKDFSALIEKAKTCNPPDQIETGEITGGFAHNQVFALADKVVEAVKSGAVKKFIVMAGCDGRSKSRKYYTDFASALPDDTIILTAGCAKYRYNKLPLGHINGIPRVLDAGQCNDCYSLALIALKLKEVFELEDINQLPIIFNISWYEQKAVIVLLALLHLGVKKIHLGPTLPAFLSPNVAGILVETFGIAGITTVDEDMNIFFGN